MPIAFSHTPAPNYAIFAAMGLVRTAISYVKYLLRARNRHGVHSPFVYELSDNVFQRNVRYYDFHTIEYVRESMLRSSKKLQVVDLGAGSKSGANQTRSLAGITRTAAIPAEYGQLLYRLVNHVAPTTIVELGTSVGIGTLYLASPIKSARVITLEGAPEVAAIARKNLDACNLDQVEIVEGNFDDTLPRVLQNIDSVDFAYIDGNHRLEPTLRYFEQLKAKSHANTVLVFDDIHWSSEMEQAWQTIQADAAVTVSIDVWRLGLVFFKPGQQKEHFTLKLGKGG